MMNVSVIWPVVGQTVQVEHRTGSRQKHPICVAQHSEFKDLKQVLKEHAEIESENRQRWRSGGRNHIRYTITISVMNPQRLWSWFTTENWVNAEQEFVQGSSTGGRNGEDQEWIVLAEVTLNTNIIYRPAVGAFLYNSSKDYQSM